jgi:hypothetical protein
MSFVRKFVDLRIHLRDYRKKAIKAKTHPIILIEKLQEGRKQMTRVKRVSRSNDNKLSLCSCQCHIYSSPIPQKFANLDINKLFDLKKGQKERLHCSRHWSEPAIR